MGTPKKKHHVQDLPKQEYLSKAVRNFYSNLKEAMSKCQENFEEKNKERSLTK